MTFYDSKKLVATKIREATSMDGLLQASNLIPSLQDKRAVNYQEDTGFFTPKAGTYISLKTKKEMEYESGLEKTVLEALDTMSEIKWFDTQCLGFAYSVNGEEYNYHPDIVCRTSEHQVIVIEVKPAKTACNWFNYRKYIAGKYLCAMKDWHYLILSPKEGSLEDMANYHVSELVERDFVGKIQGCSQGKYGSMKSKDIIDFKEKYDLNDRVITAIALRNDLTFHDKSFTCSKMEQGCSWKKILRSKF